MDTDDAHPRSTGGEGIDGGAADGVFAGGAVASPNCEQLMPPEGKCIQLIHTIQKMRMHSII